MFHLDARNVVATFVEPILVGPEETAPESSSSVAPSVPGGAGDHKPPTPSVTRARAVGVRHRLWETEGRPGRVKLRCFREPASARRTDFEHRPTGDLPVEGDSVLVDLCAFDYAEIEAYWKK